jgi:hypothetical protein
MLRTPSISAEVAKVCSLLPEYTWRHNVKTPQKNTNVSGNKARDVVTEVHIPAGYLLFFNSKGYNLHIC